MSFSKDEVIFTFCDNIYFHKFAKAFIFSSLKHKNATHIHIVNPDEDCLALLQKTQATSADFSYSTSSYDFSACSVAFTKAYFICARFLLIPSLFAKNKNLKLLMFDADCLVRQKIQMPNKPLGLFLRVANKNEHLKVLASVFYMDIRAMQYLKQVNQYIKQIGIKWFTDQIALHRAYQNISNQQDVFVFDKAFHSVEFDQNAPTWAAKGDLKFENNAFNEEVRQYEALPYLS